MAQKLSPWPVANPVIPIKLVWASSIFLLVGGGRYAAEMLLAAMIAKACKEEETRCDHQLLLVPSYKETNNSHSRQQNSWLVLLLFMLHLQRAHRPCDSVCHSRVLTPAPLSCQLRSAAAHFSPARNHARSPCSFNIDAHEFRAR